MFNQYAIDYRHVSLLQSTVNSFIRSDYCLRELALRRDRGEITGSRLIRQCQRYWDTLDWILTIIRPPLGMNHLEAM